MRVAVLSQPRRFVISEQEIPRPGRGEAVVHIAATAVCHTDLSIYTGAHPGVRYPVVLGHEAAGVVEAVGGDTRITAGTRVVINPIIACGACDCCLRGDENLCRRAGLLGLRHAQQRVRIGPGDAVVVLGQGTTGLLHTQLAKLSGANPVMAVSRSAWKRDLARRMRADETIDPVGRDATAEVLRFTNGRGADVVIDTTGDSTLLRPAMEMLRPGGTLLLYAISHEAVPDFTTFSMYYKELTLVGSRALVPADFEPAAAFEDYERNPDRVLRLLIVP